MSGPPAPAAAVGLELLRALGALALLPVRVPAWLLASGRLRRELLGYLGRETQPVVYEPPPLPDRPLRIFVSWAEPSGELHALNLIESLRGRARRQGAPAPRFTVLGSRAREAEDLRVIGDPADRAAMGFGGPLASVPYYLGLLRTAAGELAAGGFDVCVPVDSPALHVPLGRIARRCGVPVVHFVTPQYWGWAPWRVAGYRAAVDRALTILPFEPPWFERRGVPAVHVGHPLLDELRGVPGGPPASYGPRLAILPGSRAAVARRNLPFLLRAAAHLRERIPGLEAVLPHARSEAAEWLTEGVRAAGAQDWARVEVGDLHASLAGARAALSVSGTALLDLLHRRLPTVVVYRLGSRPLAWMSRHLLTTPWFASLNLLAGREVVPEFCFAGEGPLEAVSRALEGCYNDGAERDRQLEGLEVAARRLGPPGAADRAAAQVLGLALAGRGSENPSRGAV